MPVDTLFNKFYSNNQVAYQILHQHCLVVKEKALEIAHNSNLPNLDFNYIEQAAMLHDIGVFLTRAPNISCYGNYPYLAHGYLGRGLLEKEGLVKLAPICERHVGVGISKTEIIRMNLPLPERDMLPLSLEEKIITVADKFYSKNPGRLLKVRNLGQVLRKLKKNGEDKPVRFLEICEELNFSPA